MGRICGHRSVGRAARVLSRAVGLPLVGVALTACGSSLQQRKPIEMEPIGTLKNPPRAAPEEGDVPPSSPSGNPPGGAGQSAACTGTEFETLDATLEECRTSMPKSSELPSGLKEKLELKVTASTATILPGGRVDVVLLIRNKSAEPLPLFFTGDPSPRFEVEAIDAKGKRADAPAGKPPPWPKGTTPPSREARASRITLEKGGTAKVKLSWDAIKMKWAPDKAKTWEGRGFPRTPAGPLPNGKYMLRVVVPLIGGDMEPPRVPIEVGS